MNELNEKSNISDTLFNEIIKCAHIMKSSLHHRAIKTVSTESKAQTCDGNCRQCTIKFESGCIKKRNREGSNHERGMQQVGQIKLLSILSQSDGISQKELSEKLEISTASVSELANKLEIKGYITREQNIEDKRVINVFLTQAGAEFAQKMQSNRIEFTNNFFSGLDEKEQEQLLELLKKLNESTSEFKVHHGCMERNFNPHHKHRGQNHYEGQGFEHHGSPHHRGRGHGRGRV